MPLPTSRPHPPVFSFADRPRAAATYGLLHAIAVLRDDENFKKNRRWGCNTRNKFKHSWQFAAKPSKFNNVLFKNSLKVFFKL